MPNAPVKIAPHLHWDNSHSLAECDKVMGEIILPGNERYDWGKENLSPKGRRAGKNKHRWTAVINGEMRPKQPEPGHINSRFKVLGTQ